MFPDKATLYVCAIEDRQYKDDKINWWAIELNTWEFIKKSFLGHYLGKPVASSLTLLNTAAHS